MAAYEEAKGIAPKPSKSGIGVGTWRWLCTKYFAECADYKRLDPRTRHVRRLVLEATFEEPIAPGSPKFFRDLPLSLPPRGLSREEAAAYIGVSPSLFDILVKDGRMPGPKRINSRVVWDRLKLDVAFEVLDDTDADGTDDEWRVAV